MRRPVSASIYLPIILILVLSVVSGNIAAQSEPGLCTPRAGYDLINYGRQWNAWSNTSRSIYLAGFVDGSSHTYILLLYDLPAERRERRGQQIATLYERSTLRDVMTSLYSDPANTYIAYDSMVYIARDKLGGKDIEVVLRNARQNNCGYTETGR